MDNDGIVHALLADGPWMRRVACAVAGDTDSAQDLLLDLCVAVLVNPPRDPLGLRAWASSMMRKRMINFRKREKRVILSDSLDQMASERGDPTDPCSLVYLRASVFRAVMALPQDLHEPVVKRYWQGLSTKDVASSMGIDPRTVNSRLWKAWTLLKLSCASHRAGW